MIRINLVAGERRAAKAAEPIVRDRPEDHGRRQPDPRRDGAAGRLALLGARAGRRRSWSRDIDAARREETRLAEVLKQVARLRSAARAAAAARRAHRRAAQGPDRAGPHRSIRSAASLPEMTWLTSLKQEGYDVTIEGPLHDADGAVGLRRQSRGDALLQAPGRDRRRARSSPATQDGPELIEFTIKGTFQMAGIDQPAPPPAKRQDAGQGREQLADLSLSKLPWKAQLAMFVVLSLGGAGAFYYFYEMPTQARIATQQRELDDDSRAHRQGAGDGAAAARVPQGSRPSCRRGSRACKPILPEEKDAADLLRRVHTLARAVEPDDSRLQAAGRSTRASCTPSGRSASSSKARITTSGTFLDRVSKFPRIINVGKLDDSRQAASRTPNATIDVTCTATTFVLLDAAADAAAGQEGRPPRSAPKKTE